MNDSIGKPRQDIEDGVFMGGENVGQVGAVEDVLEGGQDADPDVRAIFVWDESATVSFPFMALLDQGKSYRLQKKYSNHIQIIILGRKNCPVAGISSNHRLPTTAKVLVVGALGAIYSENIVKAARKTY